MGAPARLFAPTRSGRTGTAAGRRPDGRVLDDEQVRDGLAVSVDQYIVDLAAVEAFWA